MKMKEETKHLEQAFLGKQVLSANNRYSFLGTVHKIDKNWAILLDVAITDEKGPKGFNIINTPYVRVSMHNVFMAVVECGVPK